MNPLPKTAWYCRLCHQMVAGIPRIHLGVQALTAFADDPGTGEYAPLELVECPVCSLVQLRYEVSRDRLYRGFYPYLSGMNRTMVRALGDLTGVIEQEIKLKAGDVVLDIGCNDGTMLASYRTPALSLVGFEPSPHAADLTAGRKIQVIRSYFAGELAPISPKARVITAVAMFYSVDDPMKFMRGVASSLASGGVFVLQMNDLASMLSGASYDIIGHEHLCYYGMASLRWMLDMCALEIYRVEHFPLNGGTARYWIGHAREHPIEPSVANQIDIERSLLGDTGWEAFQEQVERSRDATRSAVFDVLADGGRVYGYGAATRGSTILQTCGLDASMISGLADIDPRKIGKYLAGPDIPVVSEQEAREKASLFLVLPYSYAEEFILRESEFIAGGGQLFFPLPVPRLVGRQTEL